jgi:hypothetical protein
VTVIKTVNPNTPPAATHATGVERLQQLLYGWFLAVVGENQPL